jgi:arsenate reductase
MKRLTVSEKPTCTTCRRLVALPTERAIGIGIRIERVNYLLEPLNESKLRARLQKTGVRPRDVMGTTEPTARGLPMNDDEATLRALALHPELRQRPNVECDDRAVVARPPERSWRCSTDV